MRCLHPWVPRAMRMLTFLLLGLILVGAVRDPESWWAPGDISRYHAEIADCQACHEPFRGPTAGRCRSCHTDRSWQMETTVGRSVWHQEIIQDGQSCLGCHAEHRGVQAVITPNIPKSPHGDFIFSATGARTCSACHEIQKQQEDEGFRPLQNAFVQRLLEKGGGRHQPGTFARCSRCHGDLQGSFLFK